MALPKIVQLVVSAETSEAYAVLYALDVNGEVWQYIDDENKETGWIKLDRVKTVINPSEVITS